MRKAVVLHSNGPASFNPLKYTDRDAAKLSEALSSRRCGFEIVDCPDSASANEIRNIVADTIESCSKEDTLLLAFSGHGILEKGSLFLLLDQTDRKRLLTTAVPVADLLRAMDYCQAENKLFILDCCHAGAAMGEVGGKGIDAEALVEDTVKPETFLILMASDRIERAREVEALEGGFLTQNICKALTTDYWKILADRRSRLSMQKLKGWLETKTKEHNSLYRTSKVPTPFLFGQQRGDFYFSDDDTMWTPEEIRSADQSTMVVLPLYPDGDQVYCLAKHPVTNQQYREILGVEPIGKAYTGKAKDGWWKGPFEPMKDPDFASPDKPVVCVSYRDALRYAHAVDRRETGRHHSTRLPDAGLWTYAAFQTEDLPRNPKFWMQLSPVIHHKADFPAAVESDKTRTNRLGISDLIGNVWEWCGPPPTNESLRQVPSIVARPAFDETSWSLEILGGGFLDDLSRTPIDMRVSDLPDELETAHTDLGFRISGRVPLDTLSESMQEQLMLCPRLTNREPMRIPAAK